MHPWRGRSRPPQSNLPLKDPVSALEERHPQLVASETFLERPLRTLDGEAGDRTLPSGSWAKDWQAELERWEPLREVRAKAEELIFAEGVWHLDLCEGEIVGIVRDERLYAARIGLPGLGQRAEAGLIEHLEGKVESVKSLLDGKVPHEVRQVLLDPEQGLLPPLGRARTRCQCGARRLCPHVGALLLAVTARMVDRPKSLFRLRRTSPEVLRGLLPDALTAPLPEGITLIDPNEVAKVFDLRLYIPEPLPPLEVEPPPVEPTVEEARTESNEGGSWLDDDWDEDDDGPIFGGASPVEQAAAPPETVSAEPAEPAEELPEISRSDLLDLGFPSHRVQKMLSDGRLVRTQKRGLYQLTAEAWEEIEPLLPDAS